MRLVPLIQGLPFEDVYNGLESIKLVLLRAIEMKFHGYAYGSINIYRFSTN